MLRGDKSGQSIDESTTASEDGLPKTLLVSVLTLLALALFLAVTQLLTLIVLRATLGQFLFGFAVVIASGAPAGRVRLLVRWLIAWAIPIAVFFWGTRITETSVEGSDLLPLLALVPWFIGLAVAAIRPHRGLHDSLTGCWLVPR